MEGDNPPKRSLGSVSMLSSGMNDVSAADVQFFKEELRSWHQRSFRGGSPSSRTWKNLRRESSALPTQMSAPVGGSHAMLLAAQKYMTEDPAIKISPFSYGDLRLKVRSIGSEVLLESWIEQHAKMVECGLMNEAQQSYNQLKKILDELQPKELERPSLIRREDKMTGLDKLLKDGLLAFLLKLQPYIPPLPPQIVTFKNLSYTAKVRRSKEGYETVGSKFYSCLFPFLQSRSPVENFPVMAESSGYLMPGTMTLVCGPPGCGKSTFHQALAGRLHSTAATELKGSICYNGHSPDSFQVRRVAALVDQTDKHIPSLTVRETCEFAAACTQLWNTNANSLPLSQLDDTLAAELGGTNLKMQLILHLLGLEGPADTRIGSRVVRGVSGGERHRVTTAEMLSGTYICFFFDEISTGLDSSATYDIVSALRTFTRVRSLTCLFSLLQPAPEVFDLFDRLLVLDSGRVIYQGPRQDVLHHFHKLGYSKPPHVDIPDFLQEVTTDAGLHFLQPGAAPLNTEQFEAAYRASPMYADVQRLVEANQPHPAAADADGVGRAAREAAAVATGEEEGERGDVSVATSTMVPVTRVLWVEAVTPLGITLEPSSSKAGVYIADILSGSPLAEASMDFTDRVKVGDRITAVADSEGKPQEYWSVSKVAEEGGEEIGEAEWQARSAVSLSELLQSPDERVVRLQVERESVLEGPNLKQQQRGHKDEAPAEPHNGSVSDPLSSAFVQERFSHEYAQDWWHSTATVCSRQFTIAARNTAFFYARMAQVLVLGVVTGTVFYQLPGGPAQAELDLRKSLAFLAALAMTLGAISQIPTIIDERQVFRKQYDARFFRPASYVLAGTLSQIPFSLCEIVIYTPLVYWLTGLSSSGNGVHFLVFVLLVFLLTLMGSSMVRLVASISATREAAGGLAGLVIITMLLFTGFLAPKNKVPDWWIWMYYVSPLQYGVTAIVCNEFLSSKYSQPCASNLDTATYCVGRQDLSLGEAYLDSYDLPTDFFIGVWLGAIVLLAYYMLFTALTFAAVAKMEFRQPKQPPPLPSDSKDNEGTELEKLVKTRQPKGGMLSRLHGRGREEAKEEEEEEVVDVESLTPVTPSTALVSSSSSSRQGSRQGEGDTAGVGSREEAAAAPSPAQASAVLYFTPTTLSFHDLCYEVDIPGAPEPRLLLSNVSGYAKPGTMTALMGSSGAGKTTLLDVLAGIKTVGRTRGHILVNGYPKVQQTFARISGYVEQNDIHTPFITVKESLEFSAALRLPSRAVTLQDRKEVVDQAIALLELSPIANKLVGFIGEAGQGLSVEEAKRLTIAVELVANPSVLFLDEPTSGLDSRAAQIVIRGVQNVVATGRSVICTIHQPSRRLFLAFDQLLLLKRGGQVAYFGAVGANNAHHLLSYFHGLPGLPRCGEDQNPASYMLEMIGAGVGHAAHRDFALDYQNSALCESNEEELQRLLYGRTELGPEPTEAGYAATWPVMVATVIMRQYRTYWRNVSYSFGRMTFVIVLGLLLGSTFWQVTYDTRAGLAARSGFIYISIVFVAIVNANNVIPQVNAERPVYYREKASNMYSAFLYDFSWGLAEAPYLAISTLLFCAICLPMVDIAVDSLSNFFLYWLIFFEYAASITFFGILMAMVTPNAPTASIIIPVVINIWNIMSGFIIPKDSIPKFWIFLYYLNPTQYAINALNSIAFYCDLSSNGCNIEGCLTNSTVCPDCQCVRLKDAGNVIAWNAYKSERSLEYGSRGVFAAVLLLFIVVFRFGAYLALKYARYNRR